MRADLPASPTVDQILSLTGAVVNRGCVAGARRTTINRMAGRELTDSPESDNVDDLLSKTLQRASVATRPRRSRFGMLLWALSSIPVGALVLLLSMAVRVWIADGAWPERNLPDPKDLGVHNTITVLTILASFPAAVVVPLLSLARSRFGRGRTPLGPLLLGVIGFVVLFVVLRADVAGLGDWIGD